MKYNTNVVINNPVWSEKVCFYVVNPIKCTMLHICTLNCQYAYYNLRL